MITVASIVMSNSRGDGSGKQSLRLPIIAPKDEISPSASTPAGSSTVNTPANLSVPPRVQLLPRSRTGCWSVLSSQIYFLDNLGSPSPQDMSSEHSSLIMVNVWSVLIVLTTTLVLDRAAKVSHSTCYTPRLMLTIIPSQMRRDSSHMRSTLADTLPAV